MSDLRTVQSADVLLSQLLEDDDSLRDIVIEFVDGLSRRAAELRHAHEQLDWEMLRMFAHRLKGAGGSFGYPVLSELGRAMENEFKNHSADHFAESLEQLEQLAAAAKSGLNAD